MAKTDFPGPDLGKIPIATTTFNGEIVPHVQADPRTVGYDAFARLRVSNPDTIFDSKQIFDKQPLFWGELATGAGTSSTHSVNAARTRLAVSNTTTGNIKRQTFMRFNYQPGKSQLITMTARVSSASVAGIKASVGIFDDNNGIFFTDDNGVVKAVIRSNVTGSPVDTEVVQSSFNRDTFDGAGPSGVTLDPTKVQILFFDYEWLGSGRARLGFFVDGVPVVAHEFQNTNVIDTVYMSTPNLPLRYELDNDGNGPAVSMDHICSTVISEGGSQALGIIRHAGTDGTALDAALTATAYALLGIRLKAAYLGATILPLQVEISEYIGSKFYEWDWLLNPVVADTFAYGDVTNSAVQIARGALANTVTGGTHLGGGLASSAFRGGSTIGQLTSALRLGSDIGGSPDELVLVVTLRNGDINGDFEATLLWRELT